MLQATSPSERHQDQVCWYLSILASSALPRISAQSHSHMIVSPAATKSNENWKNSKPSYFIQEKIWPSFPAQFTSTLSVPYYIYMCMFIYILSALLISLFRCFNVHYKKWNWTKCIKYSAIILCIAKNVHRTYSVVEVCRKQNYCNFPDQIIFPKYWIIFSKNEIKLSI